MRFGRSLSGNPFHFLFLLLLQFETGKKLRSKELNNAQNSNLIPLERESQGPFRWSRRPGFFIYLHGWMKFKPVTLFSDKGVIAVIEPFSKEWYESSLITGGSGVGYFVRTYDAEYVLHRKMERPGLVNGRKSRKFVSHVKMTEMNGSSVAELSDDRHSLRFNDGESFAVKWGKPLYRNWRCEFFDANSYRQFYAGRKWAIYPEPGARDKYLLRLMIIQRFLLDLMELDGLMAAA